MDYFRGCTRPTAGYRRIRVVGHEVLEILGRFHFHFGALEMEHIPYESYERMAHLCRVADSLGITPIASLGQIDPLQIQKVLELGAMGVMVPHVIKAEDALRAVEAAKFPPDGRRGTAGAITSVAVWYGFP